MMQGWWKSIEQHLDERSELAPDPWSDRCRDSVDLTDAQQRYLGALEDQPPIARLTIAAPPDDAGPCESSPLTLGVSRCKA